MSTKLTKNSISMVDSRTLKLFYCTAGVNENIAAYLSQSLSESGYESVTPSVLSFLSALECGVNYGSEIARNLGVSRQMVAKTVKELSRVGYLDQIEGVGKQKEIVFTKLGEQLISDARQLLLDLDRVLEKELSLGFVNKVIERLGKIDSVLMRVKNS